jgi:membrane protease YdiL (CAAX protease family)
LLALRREGAAASALEGLGAGLVLLPLFFAGVWLFWRFKGGDASTPNLARAAATQVLLVAVPEEFFFRAFLQAGMARARRRTVRLLGARLGWELPAASALFALAHLAARQAPQALLVFFPGLVMGWLWARRESLVGPVIFHALCNLSLVLVEPGLF